MKFDPYNILHDTAVGAALGGSGQFTYTSFKKNKDRLPVLGTALGAGAGALTGMYLNKYRAKQNNTSVRKRLQPGLYYMERGLFGDNNLFKGTDLHKHVRHGFFLGVYDEKPVGIETDRLPNGQFVVTFGSYPKNNPLGLPEELYFAVNGKNPSAGIDVPSDLRAVKSLFDSDAQKYTDYVASIHPIDLDPDSSKKSIENLYNTTRKYEGQSLGSYHPFKNNCLSTGAELARAAGIDIERLPVRLGGIGGFNSEDIPNLPDHLSGNPPKKKGLFDFGWLKSSEFNPAFTKKSKLCKAANYVRNQRANIINK